MDLILAQNLDKLYVEEYPEFKNLFTYLTNLSPHYFAFILDLYEKSTQIFEFDGYKPQIAMNFLDKMEDFEYIKEGGNFYSNFLQARYLLMLSNIKEKNRAINLFQISYEQIDLLQDNKGPQVYLIKSKIIENILFLTNSDSEQNKIYIREKLKELEALNKIRPSRTVTNKLDYLFGRITYGNEALKAQIDRLGNINKFYYWKL
ncbi:hypothetical protein PPERSA_10518 [Pseudocohnilembus persalinus]|uniref:Uncharacterized protein n=1 Tax=Pseudocohnilembus persalinus TaxID=266149 RepID=A0A0V0R7G1_PSEPJ|nr:hypothetical protein PPERSA_10518 [Pseudocohnilembus persalinus]|eukprot:KRX10419.1 hypothetical protein PPERSA_10518 [Pseudocohnilembus persalinus]